MFRADAGMPRIDYFCLTGNKPAHQFGVPVIYLLGILRTENALLHVYILDILKRYVFGFYFRLINIDLG